MRTQFACNCLVRVEAHPARVPVREVAQRVRLACYIMIYGGKLYTLYKYVYIMYNASMMLFPILSRGAAGALRLTDRPGAASVLRIL